MEGDTEKYCKKAAECIRIGRGKPKFIGDRKGIQMAAKALPERAIEDWREFSGGRSIQLIQKDIDNYINGD